MTKMDKSDTAVNEKDCPQDLEYAMLLHGMFDDHLANEYMAMLAGEKTEIGKTLINHEMAKRFFKQWSNNALK